MEVGACEIGGRVAAAVLPGETITDSRSSRSPGLFRALYIEGRPSLSCICVGVHHRTLATSVLVGDGGRGLGAERDCPDLPPLSVPRIITVPPPPTA